MNLLYLLDEFVVFVRLWGETVFAKPLLLQVPAKELPPAGQLSSFCFSFAFLTISIGFAI